MLSARYRMINNDTSVDALTRLYMIGVEYMKLAVKNPGQYRLMFGHEIMHQKRSAELTEAARETFGEFLRAVEAFQQEKVVTPKDPLSLAHMAWIVVHGLSSLMIDGQIQIMDKSSGLPTLLVKEDSRSSGNIHESMHFSETMLREFLEMISLSESAR